MVIRKMNRNSHIMKKENMFKLINKVLEVHSEFHPYTGTPKECASFIECNERHLYRAREILIGMGKMYKQKNKTHYKLMDYFVIFDKIKKQIGTTKLENIWTPVIWNTYIDFLADEAESKRRIKVKNINGVMKKKVTTVSTDNLLEDQKLKGYQVMLKSTFNDDGKVSIRMEIVVNKKELIMKSMRELLRESLDHM